VSTSIVFSAYAAAFVLALLLLYWFHARWYWHVLSVALALAIGLMPPPAGLAGRPGFDLAVGCVFVFLMVWGIGEIFLHRYHRERSRQSGSACCHPPTEPPAAQDSTQR